MSSFLLVFSENLHKVGIMSLCLIESSWVWNVLRERFSMKKCQCGLQYSMAQTSCALLVCFGRLYIASDNLIISCKLWKFLIQLLMILDTISLISVGSVVTPHSLFNIFRLRPRHDD